MKAMRIAVCCCVAVAMIVFATACGSDDDAGESDAKSAGPTQVEVVEDWPTPWTLQIPWNVAAEKGWYEDAGIEVKFTPPPGTSDPSKLVGTGKVDLGLADNLSWLSTVSEGLKSIAVGSWNDHTTEGIMCWADSGIKTPKDLKGKTIAIYQNPLGQLNWDLFLEKWGLTRDDVKTVSEGNYGAPLMIQNKVDCIDASVTAEKVDAEVATGKESVFFLYTPENGLPKSYNAVIVANPDFAEQNPDAVKAFVSATMRGWQWAVDNPDAAVDIMLKRHHELTEDSLRRGWNQYVELIAPLRFEPSKPLGYMDPELWRSYQDQLISRKVLKNPVDIDAVISNDYVTADK